MKKNEWIAITVLVVLLVAVIALVRNGDIGSAQDTPNSAATTGAKCGGPYVGLSTDEAIAQAEDAASRWRIGSQDGKVYPATLDYDPTRATFDIENGKVTNATCG